MTHPWDVLNRSCREGLGERQGAVQCGLKDQRDKEVKDYRQTKRLQWERRGVMCFCALLRVVYWSLYIYHISICVTGLSV